LLLAAGVAADRFDLDAVGDTQPITDCRGSGLAHAALLQCLQADRRVDIRVRGLTRR
jgi:outer membrane protein OmpA-like peptidoglycan-associated protein